ncbi:hypothetical protein P152DRAFT_89640 [Eremomyces bilateralis CBS 781.70]|uniref:Tr-type G domain-containing protein n=1 Tax=Eremomyces bilateralis CBS 781.70 TaxID=1392243 RepID=A0A6G1FY16_9PEZI|nr:uncharacterized protein P152DRAFT_89640 [Eremomyces bilateralis CBS 781.70]KAF1810581.1 hypothetical protein P152DRAFT_89640 [Eremomyces bilateralis CBS 781.70]
MASIFTFDPDPPRVSSPWSTPTAVTPKQSAIPGTSTAPALGLDNSPLSLLESGGHGASVTKLEAEPQEGPTEYKLHLLLRPRRSFRSASTKWKLAGSNRSSRPGKTPGDAETMVSSPSHGPGSNRSVSDSIVTKTPSLASSNQTRQHRLEQLTTQLLWRLQQSAPSQGGGRHESIIPAFPNESSGLTSRPVQVGRLLPGLEESRGALYEIGVADDGTLVGLADDEMQESLDNLRAMAASLGCIVDVLRKLPVGECQWYEDDDTGAEQPTRVLKSGQLWVAEAFVKPKLYDAGINSSRKEHDTGGIGPDIYPIAPGLGPTRDEVSISSPVGQQSLATQVRVCFVGATPSGKSSLLGTLTTGTLDNGRGKSRLSLLKHRHEIESGMTSSLTQELIGYRDDPATGQSHIINRSVDHVESWVDVHAASHSGRLLLLSDSAGHPRYRRTLLRGLIGWQPHWTLVCIPADNAEDTSGLIGATPASQEILGPGAAGVDLSRAHLDLCLRIGLPLVVIITKLDVASKSGLRQTLSTILTAIKAAGRKPEMIQSAETAAPPDLATIAASDLEPIRSKLAPLAQDPTSIVPIVLSSAVNGRGIKALHAVLHELPTPITADHQIDTVGDRTDSLNTLFRVEDIYPWRAIASPGPLPISASSGSLKILSGLLNHGSISVGETLLLGPYMTKGSVSISESDAESGDDNSSEPDSTPGSLGHRAHHQTKSIHAQYLSPGTHLVTSRSYPGALDKKSIEPLPQRRGTSLAKTTWRPFRVVSIRNLRLPVQTLQTGTVGTIGVISLDGEDAGRVRKGMVMVNAGAMRQLRARRRFQAQFDNSGQVSSRTGVSELQIGSMVLVYVGSVRASAKVMEVDHNPSNEDGGRLGNIAEGKDGVDDGWNFGFEDEEGDTGEPRGSGSRDTSVTVSFQFISTTEFLETGAQVLVEPSGGHGLYISHERGEKGLAGLEFFIGRVID